MEILSYIFYLLISFDITNIRATENASSSKEADKTNIETIEGGGDKISFCKEEFEKCYEFFLSDILIILKYVKGNEASNFIDVTKEQLEFLFVPYEKLNVIFRKNNVERIKSIDELILKSKDVLDKWDTFCKMLPINSNAQNMTEGLIIEAAFFINDDIFAYISENLSRCFFFVIDGKFKKEKFMRETEEHESKFLKRITKRMEIIPQVGKVFYYDALENLIISVKGLMYNIISIVFNYYKVFNERKSSKVERKEFKISVIEFLNSFKKCIFTNHDVYYNAIQDKKRFYYYCDVFDASSSSSESDHFGMKRLFLSNSS